MPCWSKEHADKIKVGVKKYWDTLSDDEKKLKTQNFHKYKPGVIHSEQTIALAQYKALESMVGGFWYGNVKYRYINRGNGKRYCELWTEDLKERIRAYWGYASPLSNKTASENGGRNLSCHHIYYQEKACCEWDDDEKGYYAWINIATNKNPKQFKYYIEGDPNKFIPLTIPEHIETNHNRLKWIRLFEDIIDEQGGKCYFTKKELEELVVD